MNNLFIKIKKNIYKGFTLAELIIVIAIIAIISTLTLFNNAKLNSSVLLSNTAYEIGLIVRDAQISGLGAKVSSVEGGGATTTDQGIYIDLSKPEQLIFFSDKNKDRIYNISEENQIYNIENKRAGRLLRLCLLDNQLSCTERLDLNILFKRPNPESYFYYFEDNSVSQHNGSISLNIGFEGGECRSITVYKTGAIQIDKKYCE